MIHQIGTNQANPVNIETANAEAHKRKQDLSKYKRELVNYFDADSNGLNKREQYELDFLMGIEDKKKNYRPTFKEWKMAYNQVFLESMKE